MHPVSTLALLLLVFSSACSSNPPAEKAAELRPGGRGTVEVQVENVGDDPGVIYTAIFLSEDGFPEQKEYAHDYRYAEATPGKMTFEFQEVPAGWFVVAVLHDVDGNEELSLNLLGIPEEDYGFSQNPDSSWGPPPFDEAAVYLEDGERELVTVFIAED